MQQKNEKLPYRKISAAHTDNSVKTDNSVETGNSVKTGFYTKTWVVVLGALICCALWGSAFPCVKIGYELFEIPSDAVMTQILFAGMRFALAGVLVILFHSLLQRKIVIPKKKSLSKILWLSMLQTVGQYILFYIGLAHTTGVKASVIEGLNVFVAILVSAVLFRQERLSGVKIIGCLIGFAGVVLVNFTGSGFDMELTFIGEGFIFFSTVAYAFSSVYIKRFSKTESPVCLSGYQFLVGGLIMMLIGWIGGGRVGGFRPDSILMLFYLAAISAVAYTLWGILLKYNPVSQVTVYGFMNPVFGVILSALLLNEQGVLGGKCILALVLVCVGIYVVNRTSRSRAGKI